MGSAGWGNAGAPGGAGAGGIPRPPRSSRASTIPRRTTQAGEGALARARSGPAGGSADPPFAVGSWPGSAHSGSGAAVTRRPPRPVLERSARAGPESRHSPPEVHDVR
jgi:hypothetical protein